MDDKKIFRVRSLYLASFLSFHANLQPILERHPDINDIDFLFDSCDELYKGLREFNDGALVDAKAYSQAISDLRGQMIQKKFGHR
jgi:hypothetical protein